MKKVERFSPPDCLNNDIPASRKKKRGFYQDLRKNGTIRPRWNTTCKHGQKTSEIRRRLLEMSNGSCVYCGKNIHDGEMDVEHYLPKDDFPYLAYCWDNYVPSCKYCNQTAKRNFTPPALHGMAVVEAIVADRYPHDHIYNKESVLTQLAGHDRLIEPTFDAPEEHLEFNPEFFFYQAKTSIGQRTIDTFFTHKEVSVKWEKISHLIKELVLLSAPESTIQAQIAVLGHEYVCWKFYEYWLREKEEGRI
jgi:uncharacterized protein (TIGR02646 family)